MGIINEVSITEVISSLGGFGVFQWMIVASFCFMSPPQVFQILFMLFGGKIFNNCAPWVPQGP